MGTAAPHRPLWRQIGGSCGPVASGNEHDCLLHLMPCLEVLEHTRRAAPQGLKPTPGDSVASEGRHCP
eukprot:15449860-Alexandrium_andersonii.AAC.1